MYAATNDITSLKNFLFSLNFFEYVINVVNLFIIISSRIADTSESILLLKKKYKNIYIFFYRNINKYIFKYYYYFYHSSCTHREIRSSESRL